MEWKIYDMLYVMTRISPLDLRVGIRRRSFGYTCMGGSVSYRLSI